MKTLALEFSSPERSVAIVQGGGRRRTDAADSFSAAELADLCEVWRVSEIIETGAPGANVISMIEAALREAGIEREEIACLAVGLGPGSYNGIRLAIAVAQGWRLASGGDGIKLLGLSSAECIVAQGLEEGLSGRVNVVVDAQRGEFYLAGYDLGREGWNVVEPLRLVTLHEVERRHAAGEQIIGPDIAARLQGGRRVFPRAATLGRLALSRSDFVAGENLEPIYLRQTNFVKAPPPRRPLD
jgi:tRNA threonylcarbamoyl adenosine modification protein YeaZ